MYRLSSDRCQAPIPPEWNSSDKSQICITPFMPFHFRIRGLSGIIESVGPCSHGQTLNRTAVDLHRHQLRFFLAALEHKGEDQHDCHKHQTEHIAVARTVHEALRGIGAATGRIAGLTQAQQSGGHSGGDGTEHLLHGVENGAAISSHAARQRFERSGLRRLLDERNAHHHDDVRGQEQHNTRVNTDGKEQRTTATPDSPRLGR